MNLAITAPTFHSRSNLKTAAACLIIGAVMTLCASFQTARADDKTIFEPGTKFTNTLSVAGRTVPLPKGEWEVRYTRQYLGFTKGGSPNAEHGNLFLVRKQDGKVNMGLYIFTNMTSGSGYGWVRNRRICDRKNVHFNKSDRNYNPEESECWQVNQIVNTYNYVSKNVTAQRIKSIWNGEFGTSTAIALQFLVNDQQDILRLRYLLLPVRHGYEASTDLNWKTSEWHPEAVREAPDKQRFIAAATEFGKQLLPLVKKGFEDDLAGYTTELDFTFQK